MTVTTTRQGTRLLRQMQLIRSVEETILRLRRADEVAGSVHTCVGQEAVPVAALAALDERDRVLSTYRGHGWALACGVPPRLLLAEVLGRATGTNGGRGGSAYLSAPQYRFLGENSIVGAATPIANGVALALQQTGSGGVAVVSIGDGATNQGAVHEAIVFAVARGLPVVFVCENNSWSEMTPIRDTVPTVGLAERAAGYGIRTFAPDGTDVLRLGEVFAEAVEHARSGAGPCFVEVTVPRLLGHYNGDVEHYRSDEDRAAHRARDPLEQLVATLVERGDCTAAEVTALQADVTGEVARAEAEALQDPPPAVDEATRHVLGPSSGAAATVVGGASTELAYGLAVNRALRTELAERSDVVLFGEDIAIPGGTFGVTRNLRKEFGERVFDTPISEAAILGAALGASLSGLRPVVEIMWTDFLFVAFDQVVNQMSNVRYLSRGEQSAPLVVRMQQGITPGSCAQHSQSLEALLTHIPGIKVGLPATAQDAYAMTRAAIADPDPVFLIESRALYQDRGPVDLDAPIEAASGAVRRRSGSDVALVTWGRMTGTCLQAAEALAASGVSATVLDLRWLAPLDEAAIVSAVRDSSGKVVVVHEANVTGGFGAEVAARLAERHLDELDGPVMRVGLPDVRVPAAPSLQRELLPSVDRVVQAALRLASR